MRNSTDTSLLFVYGSLRQSMDNPMSKLLRRYSSSAGKAYIHGKLYDAGSFPAAVKSHRQGEKVYGELFRLSNPNSVFERLDEYEGYEPQNKARSLYLRKKTEVFGFDGEQKGNAWAYLFNKSVGSLKPIPEGDYIQYLERKAEL